MNNNIQVRMNNFTENNSLSSHDFFFYYNIYLKNINIGKFCLLLSDSMVVIEDIYIKPNFRSLGFGTQTIQEIKRVIKSLQQDFKIRTLSLMVNSYDCSEISDSKLTSIYMKEFNFKPIDIYDDGYEIHLMKAI